MKRNAKKNAAKIAAVKAMEKYEATRAWLLSMGYTTVDLFELTIAGMRRDGRFESANLFAEHVHSLVATGEVTPFHRGLPYDGGSANVALYPEHL